MGRGNIIVAMRARAPESRSRRLDPIPNITLATEPAPAFEDLTSLRIFARVVELQSFSEAARRMGITPSTVSKHISALEAQLRTRLVNRTTRKLAVTEAGNRLYQHYRLVLEELRRAHEDLTSMESEPQGLLRASMPMALGGRKIAPAIPPFLRRYPKIKLGIDLSLSKIDMLGEQIDVAVRIGDALPDGVVAMRLAPYRHVFCAAPAYLAERGTPRTPDELSQHDCMVVPGANGGHSWPVWQDSAVVSLPVNGRLVASHGDAIYDSALAGLGISMQPRWRVEQALKDGQLVEVLSEYSVQRLSIWAVLAQRGPMPSKVKVFVEFLRDTLSDLK